MTQMPARIYKAASRAMIRSEESYRFPLMGSGTPSRLLTGFDDIVIMPGGELREKTDVDSNIILLPVAGGIVFTDEKKRGHLLSVEEALIIEVPELEFKMSNKTEERSNVLLIRFPSLDRKTPTICKKAFSFPERNTLVCIGGNTLETPFLFAGIFDGRRAGTYSLKDARNNGIFTFVVNGAFEFENRLLESRDGLEIFETDVVEFEALSENAILLILEFPVIGAKFPEHC